MLKKGELVVQLWSFISPPWQSRVLYNFTTLKLHKCIRCSRVREAHPIWLSKNEVILLLEWIWSRVTSYYRSLWWLDPRDQRWNGKYKHFHVSGVCLFWSRHNHVFVTSVSIFFNLGKKFFGNWAYISWYWLASARHWGRIFNLKIIVDNSPSLENSSGHGSATGSFAGWPWWWSILLSQNDFWCFGHYKWEK